jgi:hypothetical protein
MWIVPILIYLLFILRYVDVVILGDNVFLLCRSTSRKLFFIITVLQATSSFITH